MGMASGLEAQLMTSEETVYGTVVTPDRGFEFLEESLECHIERIESAALRRGMRVQRSDHWDEGGRYVAGGVRMELGNKGFGRWWKHCLGGVATTQPDAPGNPTVYKHTFTPGDLPIGQTIQVGRPDTGAVVNAFTYHGCKVAAWTMECAVGRRATLETSILGEDEDVATALAVVSYPTALRGLTFVQGVLTVAGSAMDVKTATVQGTNLVAEDRTFLGSALRKEPLEIGMRDLKGNLEPEFIGLTAYNRFKSGTEAELVLTFDGATITGIYKFQTKITANIRFDGKTPVVGGPGIVQNPLPFKVIDNATTSIRVEYTTTDVLP